LSTDSPQLPLPSTSTPDHLQHQPQPDVDVITRLGPNSHPNQLTLQNQQPDATTSTPASPTYDNNTAKPKKQKQPQPLPLHLRIVINEWDLEEAFVKGSGPGGQKINKKMSRVQLKHLPTGIAVEVG
jgi:hypothetical protein